MASQMQRKVRRTDRDRALDADQIVGPAWQWDQSDLLELLYLKPGCVGDGCSPRLSGRVAQAQVLRPSVRPR